MDYHPSQFRSRLAKVRGLGSAHKGSGTWIADRISALALIPLTLWFVVSIIQIVAGTDEVRLRVIASPANTIMLLLFILISLYHGYHGIKVIIEDYVHREIVKNTSLILLQFFTGISALAFVCAMLIFHLSLFSATL